MVLIHYSQEDLPIAYIWRSGSFAHGVGWLSIDDRVGIINKYDLDNDHILTPQELIHNGNNTIPGVLSIIWLIENIYICVR